MGGPGCLPGLLARGDAPAGRLYTGLGLRGPGPAGGIPGATKSAHCKYTLHIRARHWYRSVVLLGFVQPILERRLAHMSKRLFQCLSARVANGEGMRRLLLPCILAIAVIAAIQVETRKAHEMASSEVAKRLAIQVAMRSEIINDRNDLLRREVRFLATTPSVEGVVPTSAPDVGHRDANRKLLAETLGNFIRVNPEIQSMRVIGIADGGRELVRVGRSGNKTYTVPSSDLIRQQEREFFREIARRPPGSVYISGPDISRGNGRQDAQHIPVVRAGTPIFDGTGKLFGMIVVNLDARAMLNDFQRTLQHPYVILLSDEHSKIFEDTGTSPHQFSVLPDWTARFDREIPADNAVHHIRKIPTGEEFLALRRELLADPQNSGHRLFVTALYPDAAIDAHVEQTRNMLMALLAGILLLGSAAFWFYRNSMKSRLASQTERARLGAIVDNSQAAIVSTSPEGIVESWNPAAERLFGIPASEAVGQRLLERLFPGGGGEVLEHMHAMAKEGHSVVPFTVHIELPESQPRDVSLSVVAIRTPEGTFIGIATTIRDVTEQEIAKVKLLAWNADLERQVTARTSEIETYAALQRAILDSAGSAIIATDHNGIVTLFNPAAQSLLGYSAGEIVGKATPKIFHLPQELEARAQELTHELGEIVSAPQALFAMPSRGISDAREWTYLRKSGEEVPVLITVSALHHGNDDIVGYIGIAVDLSEHRRIDEALRQLTDEALAAGQAKADFLANMSHEIRTPMNAVLGLAELLGSRVQDPESRRLVRRIQRAGDSLQAIIDGILDFSKIEAGHLELEAAEFQLDDVLENLATVMGGNAGAKSIELAIAPSPPEAGRLIGDAHRLGQILINLTGNAIKFTEKGSVEVGIECLSAAEGVATLRFEVRDTGVGIPQENLAGLFNAFSQEDSSITRRFGGTGLGLAISKRLVQMMDGEIGVESRPGEGSRFWFTAMLRTRQPRKAHGDELSGLEVLIADDNVTSRVTIAKIASSLGWQVASVDSGEAAMRQALARQESGHGIEVLLLDWKMPDLDGLEVASRLRAKLSDQAQPVILLTTAYARDELPEHPLRGNVDGVLTKPLTGSSLYEAVAEARNRRSGKDSEPPPHPVEERLKGIHVLIVDDNETNRDLMRDICENEGAFPTLVPSGQAALDWLSKHPDEADIVLMDIQMPGMDGYETTRALRARPALSGLPVVALSAGVLKNEREAAFGAGMDDFIPKPFKLLELIRTVQRLAHSRRMAIAAPEGSPADETSQTKLVDLAQGISLWGSESSYRKRLEKFATEIGDTATSIATHIAKRETTEAKFELHRMRGTAAILGLGRLVENAAQMEQSLQEEADASSKLTSLTGTLAATRSAIEALLTEESPH